MTTSEDTERAERLARALGWQRIETKWPPYFCWLDKKGDERRPKAGWSQVPAVIAAIEARGWTWGKRHDRIVSIGRRAHYLSSLETLGASVADDFPTALIDAFTAACEAQEGRS